MVRGSFPPIVLGTLAPDFAVKPIKIKSTKCFIPEDINSDY